MSSKVPRRGVGRYSTLIPGNQATNLVVVNPVRGGIQQEDGSPDEGAHRAQWRRASGGASSGVTLSRTTGIARQARC